MAHEGEAERHERYAARFGLDPAAGRRTLNSAGTPRLTLEDGPTLGLERRYQDPTSRRGGTL